MGRELPWPPSGEDMPRSQSFRELFVVEARQLYSAETQLTEMFQTLAERATSDELGAAIETQLEETRTHIQRLEGVFELLDEEPGGQHCSGMATIIQETKSVLDEAAQQSRDANIVASAQRVAQYKIGAYGSLVAAAMTLGTEGVAATLRRTLEEQKAAEETLRSLTEGRTYATAAGGAC